MSALNPSKVRRVKLKMKKLNQKGFAVFELVVIVGVMVIVALAGWNIYRLQQSNGSVSTTETVKAVPSAPAIISTSDLNQATTTLDQTQLDSSADTAQLDKDLASF